jgi:hypothetical protein
VLACSTKEPLPAIGDHSGPYEVLPRMKAPNATPVGRPTRAHRLSEELAERVLPSQRGVRQVAEESDVRLRGQTGTHLRCL